MQIEVPPDVRHKGPEAVAQYWEGAYLMMRIIAKKRIEEEYGLAADSLLPLGDERDEGRPPVECFEWRWHFVVRLRDNLRFMNDD